MNNEPATKQDLQELRQELLALEARMETRMQSLSDDLKEFSSDMETRLLTAFHGYGKGQTLRMHEFEVSKRTLEDRLSILEERVMNLETGHSPRQQ